MNAFIKVITIIIVLIYVISPVDLMPGIVVDDIIAVVLEAILCNLVDKRK